MTPAWHLIPHTHWDREWYLPLAQFQARLVAVIDAALDLLERDDAQRVTLDGQTVLVEDYLTLRPEALDRIRRQVARGALEIGPWYVLADELIPSGESLIRNLLLGTSDATRLGRRSSVLYSPDAFGHPGALPALAREFGLSSGALWRGLGNPAGSDRDGYDWVSPDGTVLPLYHLPPSGYEVGIRLSHDPAAWPALRQEAEARGVSGQYAVFVGADHHLTPDLSALREPGVRISSLSEFMEARARGDASPSARNDSVRGELRNTGHTWVLQGVHGTRARMKRAMSRAELFLSRIAEPLVALAPPADATARSAGLRRAWRLLIQSQFHDTIGGCCVDAVARTQEQRLADVTRVARETAEQAFDALVGHDADAARDAAGENAEALVLWNPAARIRGGVMTAELAFFRRDVIVGPPSGRTPREGPGFEPFTLMDGVTPVPVQVLGVRPGTVRVDARRHAPDQDEVDRVFVAFRAPPLGGLESRSLGILRQQAPFDGEKIQASPGRLSNRFVKLRISPTGVIDLTDLETGERYPALAAIEDEADAGDTYTWSRGSGRPIRGGRAITQEVVASGPLLGAIETTWELAAANGGTVGIRQVVTLRVDSKAVHIRLEIDNHANDHRLRARFPVDAGDEAIAGAAFGFERRGAVEPDRRPGVIERPTFTAPAHRYVAAGEHRRVLAISAPGFFEYEWTWDKELLVTLVRSVGELSRAELPERPGHAGWPEAVPLAQESGVHVIDLAIAAMPEATQTPEPLETLWEDAYLPVQARYYREFTGNDASAGIALEGAGLIASAIKPGEDGTLVLRCWNALEETVNGAWVSSAPIRDARLIRADETEVADLVIEDERVIRLTVSPRALATISVARAP